MEQVSIARGQALRVSWVDSTHSSGWKYEKLAPVNIEEVISLGFVAGASSRGLSLTTSISNRGGVLSTICIPWEAITKVQDIAEWARWVDSPDDETWPSIENF